MADKETIKRAASGDQRALRSIIDQYTPLVHKMVNKYAFLAPAHSKEDLFQEGVIGLYKAIVAYDPNRPTCFMTLAFPTVRGAVQGAARREKKHPKYALSLEQSDWDGNLEDKRESGTEYKSLLPLAEDLVVAGCGSTTSRRALMVCDRFGLMGHEPMRQGEVAQKWGITKQALQSQMSRFNKKIREDYPDLRRAIQ